MHILDGPIFISKTIYLISSLNGKVYNFNWVSKWKMSWNIFAAEYEMLVGLNMARNDLWDKIIMIFFCPFFL
jgi:hypothetical protein